MPPKRGSTANQARSARAVFTLSALPTNPMVSLRYQTRTERSGYLDHLTLNVREPLTYRQRLLWFSDPHARRGTLHRYTVTQASAGLLWDVTDPQSVAQPSLPLARQYAHLSGAGRHPA